jgi:hypothetical protein
MKEKERLKNLALHDQRTHDHFARVNQLMLGGGKPPP